MEYDMHRRVPVKAEGESRAAESPRARQRKYEAQVAEAIEQRRYGKMLWAELARDYNAAIAGVLILWRQVDSTFTAK